MAYQVPFIISNLVNGKEYEIKVACSFNSAQTFGDYSESAFFIPFAIPTSPLVIPIQNIQYPSNVIIKAFNAGNVSSDESNQFNIIFTPKTPIITLVEPSNSSIIIHLEDTIGYSPSGSSFKYVFSLNDMPYKYIVDGSNIRTGRLINNKIIIPYLQNGRRYKVKLFTKLDEYESNIVETDYYIPYGPPFPPKITKAWYDGTLNVNFKAVYNSGNGREISGYRYCIRDASTSIYAPDVFYDISYVLQQTVGYGNSIKYPATLKMKSVNVSGLISETYTEAPIYFKPTYNPPVIEKTISGADSIYFYLAYNEELEKETYKQYRYSLNGESLQMAQIVDSSCIKISNLQAGLAYRFRIVLYNGHFFSAPSIETNLIGVGLIPNKVAIKHIESLYGGFRLLVGAETNGANNGIRIDGWKYRIITNVSGQWFDLSVNGENKGIINVSGPGKHTIQVKAYNIYDMNGDKSMSEKHDAYLVYFYPIKPVIEQNSIVIGPTMITWTLSLKSNSFLYGTHLPVYEIWYRIKRNLVFDQWVLWNNGIQMPIILSVSNNMSYLIEIKTRNMYGFSPILVVRMPSTP